MNKRRSLLGLCAAAVLAPVTRFAQSQAFPARPIKLVIPFPPGGAYDAVGRPWAERVKPLLGPVVVENNGGGAGSIGAASVARAKPDGYALLLGGTLTHVNEALLKSHPLYDAVKDLDPVAAIAANYLCVAVHPSVPAQTLAELVAYAKANLGKLSYGHAGVGSIQHLAGELFKARAGTPDIVPVAYRGTGPLVTDLIGGQVPIGTPGVTRQLIEFHRAGRVRVLAVMSASRLAAAPELPTTTEAGFPDLKVSGSIGVLAPAGTPRPIVDQIAQATRAVLAEPGFRQGLIDAGIEPMQDPGPEKFRQSLAADVAFWAPVVKSLGVRVD